MTVWERWVRHPKTVWLRRAVFQVHLWSGLGIGLYIVVISLSGSVLVYRSAAAAGPQLPDDLPF